MISVLTPSYQYGRFLSDAIESVLRQGVQLEHVIQDGGSTDQTHEVLEGAAPTVRWVMEPDSGQSDALNRALTRARGEWVAWLNADEFYLPGGLARLFDAAKETGADVVYGDCVFVDEHGRVLRLVPQHRFYRRILEQFGPFIASCATIFRREVLGETPWDPAVERIMDWDLYLRLAAAGARFHWVPYPVGAFRVHGSRITARPAEEFEDSYRRVSDRWGLPRGSIWLRVGRLMHGLAKLAAGSYARQVRARRLRGRDLRWFQTDEGWRTAVALLREVYRVPPPARPEESGSGP
jgi:glycosyltransferase involved in cell wall biosynthesis